MAKTLAMITGMWGSALCVAPALVTHTSMRPHLKLQSYSDVPLPQPH